MTKKYLDYHNYSYYSSSTRVANISIPLPNDIFKTICKLLVMVWLEYALGDSTLLKLSFVKVAENSSYSFSLFL